MPVNIDVPGLGPVSVPDDVPVNLVDDYVGQIAKSKGINLPAPALAPAPERTFGQAVSDIGASTAGGLGALVALPGQLTGIAGLTDMDNALTRTGAAMQKFGQEHKSEQLQQMERERAKKIAAEDTELGKAWVAFKETGLSPALFTSFLAEQAPQLLVGGIGAKAAKLAATGAAKVAGRELGEAALEKAATSGAVGAGVTAQGADIGSNTYQAVMKDKELDKTPEYKELIGQGLNPDEAREQLALDSARKAAGAAGVASYLTSKLPGGRAIEEAIAGKFKPGIIRGIAATAPGELVSEGLEEGFGQVASNIARPGEQDAFAGVGEAAAMGALGGLGMGTGVGALSGMVGGARERQQQAMEAAEDEEERATPDVSEIQNPFTPSIAPEAVPGEASKLVGLNAFNIDDVINNTEAKDQGSALSIINHLNRRGDIVQDGVERYDTVQDDNVVGSYDTREEAEATGLPVFERPKFRFLDESEKLAPTLGDDQTYLFATPVSREEKKESYKITSPGLNITREADNKEDADHIIEQFNNGAKNQVEELDKKIEDYKKAITETQETFNKSISDPNVTQDGINELRVKLNETNKTANAEIQKIEQQKQSLTQEPVIEAINPNVEIIQGYQVSQYRPGKTSKIVQPFATKEEAEKYIVDNAPIEQLKLISSDDTRPNLKQLLIQEAPTGETDVTSEVAPTPSVTPATIPEIKPAEVSGVAPSVSTDIKPAAVPDITSNTAPTTTAQETPEITSKNIPQMPAETVPQVNVEPLPDLHEETFQATPEMQKQIDSVSSRMRGVLDQMGLQNIGLNIQQKLQESVNGKLSPIDGRYLNRVISASLEGSRDVTSTIGHETTHALRELGMFSDKEWNILTKKAQSDWIKKYDTEGRYKALGLSDEKIVEEAVSDAFGDWLQNNLQERGAVAGLLNRIKLLFQKVGDVFRGQGFTNSEDVFKRARTGKLQGERVAKEGEGAQYAKDMVGFVMPSGMAKLKGAEDVRQAGDGRGRGEGSRFAPLEGATSVRGFQGPDPRLVRVAEDYARRNGIQFKRQSEWAKVDPDRAKRIADAYEAMEHAPTDPVVREAYDNLINQTVAQYQALADAGYKFWFIDLNNPENVEYLSSPWNAMRDIRANKEMGVFPTNYGFGSDEEFSPEANPLLKDTGIKWPVGGVDGPLQPVLANDLFRAVHDAFGHGLEGAGFRADGEENAWQAHRKLFTGSAVGAITSETRGQNSWLNFGPHGEIPDAQYALPRTVNVDGKERPTATSEGRPIFPTKEGVENFWRWFGNSKTVDANGQPQVWYHGTQQDIEKFRPMQAKAIFVTQDPEFAKTFAEKEGKQVYDAIKTMTPEKSKQILDKAIKTALKEGEISKQYADRIRNIPLSTAMKIAGVGNHVLELVQEGIESGPNIIPAFVRAEKTFDYDNKEHIADVRRWLKTLDKDNPARIYLEDEMSALQDGSWSAIESPALQTFIRDNGYDSFFMEEGGRKNLAVYDPNQLKSAVGNKGAFSREENEIQFALPKNVLGQPATLPTWTDPTDSKTDDIRYILQDKMIDVKRVVQEITKAAGVIADRWNPYLQEELYHGRTAQQTERFLRTELRPLFIDLAKHNITTTEFEEFLHNRHAKERNDQIASINPSMPDAGSGIATKNAQNYLNALPPARRRLLDSIAQKVDDINRGTRQILVKSGLETPQTIASWEQTYPNYVPLFREDADYVTSSGYGVGQGFNIRGDFSKRTTGSTRNVVDILANVVMQRERAIVRAEKNRVAEAIYGLAVQNPNKDFWLAIDPDAIKDVSKIQNELINLGISPNDIQNIFQQPKKSTIDPRTGLVTNKLDPFVLNSDNILATRINGRNHYVLFNNNNPRAKRMVTALKNLDADQLGRVMSIMGTISRWISSVNTQYNPVFGVINFFRDVQGAALNLSTTPIADKLKDVMSAPNLTGALKGIWDVSRAEKSGAAMPNSKWAKLWQDLQNEGGQTGYRSMYSSSEERAKAIQKEINQIGENKLKHAGRAMIDVLSDYNTSMENAVRLTAYKAALDKGLSKQQAASIAKNLTVNFNRKGQIATQAGALYAFFNASVQGSSRLIETLTGPMGKKIIGGGLLLGGLQAVMLAAAGFDEDEPPEFLKERNFVIPIGGKNYISIPMPLGFNLLPNTSRNLVEWGLNGFHDSGKTIVNITGSAIESFNPIGGGGWSLQTVAPTALDPVAALAENKDVFGRPIYKKDLNPTDPTPGYLRTKDTATTWSKSLSEFLNMASGGTKYKPGVINVTPDQIDYLVGQAGGGVAREISKVEQTISSAATGEELPPHKIPLVGRFYGNAESNAAQSQKYYDNITRLNEHENEIKGRRKNHEPVYEYIQENPEARLVPIANSIENRIKELRQQKKRMVERGATPEQVKQINDRIVTQMKRLNEQVAQIKD